MQRRPHWDDDLIDAVSESIPYPFPEVVIYSVIAAVEDWQATQVRELEVTVCECPPKATIQRVRSVCDQWHSLIGTIPISEVLRALDGERDE